MSAALLKSNPEMKASALQRQREARAWSRLNKLRAEADSVGLNQDTAFASIENAVALLDLDRAKTLLDGVARVLALTAEQKVARVVALAEAVLRKTEAEAIEPVPNIPYDALTRQDFRVIATAEAKAKTDPRAAAHALRNLERQLQGREEGGALNARQAESAKLGELRGIETDATEGRPPTRDGWIWLLRKGRVNPERRLAGERYSALYGECRADGVRSALNDSPGSGSATTAQEKRLVAIGDIHEAHVHIRKAVGDVSAGRFITLLDAVCGRGEPIAQLASAEPRNQSRKLSAHERGLVMETDLMVGLDMLARHFGLA